MSFFPILAFDLGAGYDGTGDEVHDRKDVTTTMDGLGVGWFGLLWMIIFITIYPLGYTFARRPPLGYAVCLHGILV